MTEPGSKKTVGKLLSELEPHQLWTVVIALFASASALAGAGFNVGRFTAVSSAPAQVTALNDAPVPCHLATSWPMGGWWVWGRLENDW